MNNFEMNNCKTNCQICGGCGYIRYNVPVGHPRFGKLFPCFNLPPQSPIFFNHGLSRNELSGLAWTGIQDRENVGDAIAEIQAAIKRGKGVGYLYGGAGLAKTLLLKTACAEWVRAGKGYFHFTALSDILEDLRTAYDDNEPGRALKGKEERYANFSLLCIDEIGAQRLTDFGVEKFFNLVNRRHEAGTERGENILTIMAGNATPKEIDFRLTDRLTDGRNFIVRLTGESYRPALEWKDEPSQPADDSFPEDRASVYDTGEQAEIMKQLARSKEVR